MIECLLANVPLKETLKLPVDFILKNILGVKVSHTQLVKLFKLATSKAHFLLQGSFYDQTDGIAMDSTLGPSLANLVVGQHKVHGYWIAIDEFLNINCMLTIFFA